MNAAAVSGTFPDRLDPDAVYLTPLGRTCRVTSVRGGGGRCPAVTAVAHLEYVQPNGRPLPNAAANGFLLSRENWRLLKEVG